jgi:hypothetical protein
LEALATMACKVSARTGKAGRRRDPAERYLYGPHSGTRQPQLPSRTRGRRFLGEGRPCDAAWGSGEEHHKQARTTSDTALSDAERPAHATYPLPPRAPGPRGRLGRVLRRGGFASENGSIWRPAGRGRQVSAFAPHSTSQNSVWLSALFESAKPPPPPPRSHASTHRNRRESSIVGIAACSDPLGPGTYPRPTAAFEGAAARALAVMGC